MKINRIDCEGILGVRSASIEVHAPILLCVGANGQGKSSLCKAVTLAIDQQIAMLAGSDKRNDIAEAITDKGEIGHVDVHVDGREEPLFVTLPKLAMPDESTYTPHPATRYLAHIEEFIRAPEGERRMFLSGIARCRLNPAEVATEMVDRGARPDFAKRVTPLLRAGADEAVAKAKDEAAQARGAWKKVTGEAYGDVKAATWAAKKPEGEPPTDERIKELEAAAEAADVALDAARDAVRDIKTREDIHEGVDPEGMKRLAGQTGAREKALTAAQAAHDKAKSAIDGAKSGGSREAVHLLAAALHVLVPGDGDREHLDIEAQESVSAAVAAYEHEFSANLEAAFAATRPQDGAAIAKLQKQFAAAKSALDQARSDCDLSRQAAAWMQHASKIPPVTVEESEDADAALELAQGAHAQATSQLAAARAAATEHRLASDRTSEAAAHHADVQEWMRIADLLSPGGIPGEHLAKAMKPLRDRLAQAAADTGWSEVQITDSGVVTYGGRPYQNASKSQQWRVRAMLAEAFSFVSGLKLLILDEFDILDPAGRHQAIEWLAVLIEQQEVDSALVFATFSAIPAGLPAIIQSEWVANGHVGSLTTTEA